MDKYKQAFAAATEEEMPGEAMPGDEMMPGEDMAEGATEGGATVGVVPEAVEGEAVDPTMTEGAPAEVLSPEDAQREASWKGRLKKMEEELAAREAALAEREAGAPAMEEPAMEGEMAGEMETAPEGGMLERIKSNALALINGGGIEAAIEEAAESYGEDFLSLAAAIGAVMYGPMSQETETKFGGQIEQLVTSVQGEFAKQHISAIADAHEDFEQITESPEFNAWIEGLPEDQKAAKQEVIERGTAGRVIKMLQEFKDSLKAGEDDSAYGVRSGAPVQLPSRPGMNPDDEYLAAWKSM